MSTPTAAYARRHHDADMHAAYLKRQYQFKIGRLSIRQLRELLPTVSGAQARMVDARLTERQMHRAAQHRKQAARKAEARAAAEQDQDARLNR